MLRGVGVFLGELDGREVVVRGALRGLVEFFAEVAHVVVPVHAHAFRGHEFGDAVDGEVFGEVREVGDGMFKAALALEEEGEL